MGKKQISRLLAVFSLILFAILSVWFIYEDIYAAPFSEQPVQTAEGYTQRVSADTARYGITSVVAQDYLAGKYPNAKLSMFSAAADAMLALQSGKLDYVMTSRSTAFYMMKQDTDLKVAQDGEVDEACYIAVSS